MEKECDERDAPPVVAARTPPVTTGGETPPSSPSSPASPLVDFVDPTVITIKHWGRLLEGDLFAASSRLDWSVLLHRTFGFDALTCPACQKKMRVLATIIDPAVARKILLHLGLRADPLPRGRARDPTGQTSLDFGDAA